MKKAPVRMCIVCRQMYPKTEMIRIVKSPEGNFSIDEKGKAPGRGAYICKNQSCIDKCFKTKAINRSFKTVVSDDIYNKVEVEYNRKK